MIGSTVAIRTLWHEATQWGWPSERTRPAVGRITAYDLERDVYEVQIRTPVWERYPMVGGVPSATIRVPAGYVTIVAPDE